MYVNDQLHMCAVRGLSVFHMSMEKGIDYDKEIDNLRLCWG